MKKLLSLALSLVLILQVFSLPIASAVSNLSSEALDGTGFTTSFIASEDNLLYKSAFSPPIRCFYPPLG